jgi:hypothetical protein
MDMLRAFLELGEPNQRGSRALELGVGHFEQNRSIALDDGWAGHRRCKLAARSDITAGHGSRPVTVR